MERGIPVLLTDSSKRSNDDLVRHNIENKALKAQIATLKGVLREFTE